MDRAMDALAAFMGPGLSVAAGSRGIARNLAAAVLAVGLVMPPALAFASGPAPLPVAAACAVAAPSVQAAAEDDTVGIPREVREMLAPYAAAAVRHGLDPEAFVSAVAILRVQRTDVPPDLAKVGLAPSTGRKGDVVRTVDPTTNRWLDLMRRHGRAAGAGQALDVLAAATGAEDGKRRKPLVEATVQRLFEMRGDVDLEADVLAREAAEVSGVVGALNATETYVLFAYGVEGLSGVAKAARAPGRPAAAHKVLGVAPASSDMLKFSGPDGKERPATIPEFVGRLDQAVEGLRDTVRGVIERSSATLDEPAAPSLG